MSSVINTTKGKRFDMSKKILKNPKYNHVKSTLDTGASMSKYMAKVEEIKENYKFRKDEIYKRMKISTFAQLIVQVNRLQLESEYYDGLPETPSSSHRPDTADHEVQMIQAASGRGEALPLEYDTARSDSHMSSTQRSTLQSVTRGVGELDLNQPEPSKQVVNENNPYLLLDVRDFDDYEMCHIISAYSYPKATLSRATNYETKEMLQYRNKPGCIVVIYDECENIAPNVATTLVQRGYDNLFMLSGGLKIAAKVFPRSLVTGTLPPSVTMCKPREFLPASQKAFNIGDIDSLEMMIDNALDDKSTSSLSRLSQPSSRASRDSASRSSAASSRSHVQHSRPFIA